MDSAKVTVNPNPVSNFSYTDVCQGDSSVFTDKSTIANAYNWSFGDGKTSTLSNPKHLYASNGSYTVFLKVISKDGCTNSSSQKISINNCVWPGDANDDKQVDMNDFLAIGHAFGTKGHLRPSASSSWTGQPAPDWDSVFASGVNYKHADCNGDSIINYSDTVAISDNYGKTHSKSNVLNQGSSSDPSFTIKSIYDTIYAGDTLKAIFSTGSVSNKVQNIYAMLFSLGLNPAVFDINRVRIEMNPSFLGTINTDMMAMKINNVSSGLVDIGLTRINQVNVSGYGSFATLYVPVKTTLPTNTLKSAVGIYDNAQLSYSGKNIPLYFSSDSFVVKQDRSGINNVISGNLSDINVYPNPFQNSTIIEYRLKQKSNVQIGLYDMTGKQIDVISTGIQVAGTYQMEMNASKYHLTTGIYELRIMTEDGYVSRHIVKL